MRLRRPWLLISIAALVATAGCNLFDPFDSATSDDQLLSAARACFDRGDIACARENYAKLSASQADVAASEEAFAILDENGATMAAFMEALGDGGGGDSFNVLARKFAAIGTSGGAGTTRRQNFHTAFLKINSITGNSALKGLVRFLTAFAFASEILAEGAGTDGIFNKTDLVGSVSGCAAVTLATVCSTGSASCVSSNTAIAAAATVDLEAASTTSAVAGGSPTWGLLDGAIAEVNQAFGATELGASGKFDSGAGAATKAFDAQPSTDDDCYRKVLFDQGVGE